VKIAVIADPQVSFAANSCNCANKPTVGHSNTKMFSGICCFRLKGFPLQLMDSTSLGLPASSVVLQAVELFTDLNMRRSFQSVILPFKPDVVLFLGDHFDGGPYLSDEE
jgi:hypothetical protein